MIGLIQLHTKDNLNNRCKIAWIIGYDYTKNGYAKEAAREVISFALNKLGFHRIEAEIVENNLSSIKLAESLGMHYESLREDDYKIGDEYYNQKVYTIINKRKK